MKWLLLVSLFFFEAYSEPLIQRPYQTPPTYLDKHLLKPHSFSPDIMPNIPSNTFYVSDEVSAYIDEAISLFQEHSIERDRFDWKQFENCFYNAVNYCAYTWQTYPKMQYIAKWLDKHTHFSPPDIFDSYFTEENDCLDEIQARILDNNVAYLKVPPTNCESGAYAAKMRSLIRELDKFSPTLWILDLRGNNGGDFWEMFAGLSPLFSHEAFGFFGTEEEEIFESWIFNPGRIIYKNNEEEINIRTWDDVNSLCSFPSYIAVLIDGETASAAEAVAVAFRGNSNINFFETRTCGVTTGIDLCTLSDNSVLGIASCYFFDKTKQIYKDGITPDVEIASDDPDDCLNAAIEWLTQQEKLQPEVNKIEKKETCSFRNVD